jgi:hypothetical protein
MKPIQIINNDTVNRLHIGFIVGTTCNYKCHYCFDSCNDGLYRFPTDLNLLKRNLSHIINLYRDNFNKSHIRIHITGGEPTLWPELGKFTEYFNKELDCKISLSTNGTRTIRFWNTYASYFDDIGISIHNERCDPDHIIKVMDHIYNNSPDVLVNGTVLMDPINWDRCMSIVDRLVAHQTPWLLKVRPVLFNGKMLFFNEKQVSIMSEKIKKCPPMDRVNRYKELETIQLNEPDVTAVLENGETTTYNTFNFLTNDWQHFQGWQCNLGIDRFGIERNGDIQGTCGARNLFGLDAPLNIYDPKLPEKFTPDIIKTTICPQQSCLCATDIRMTKKNV